VKDCFDGDCTLLLTGPTTIPLDFGKPHDTSMNVTATAARVSEANVAYGRAILR
jgi:hypothetical protein